MDMAVGDHDGHASGVMDSLGEVDETVARDKPEWTTPNRMVVDLAALRLRDFSVAQEGRHKALVVAPFALHDAALADLAPGYSLVETLLANGYSRLFLAEWKSATMDTRLHTIDTQLAALNGAGDDTGPPVDLIGLGQGGWLSLVYAARFPRKVRRLVLAGAPVDITAAPSVLSTAANPITGVMIDELIRLGDGLVRGRDMANLWPRELDETSRVVESLQLAGPRRPLSGAPRRSSRAGIDARSICRSPIIVRSLTGSIAKIVSPSEHFQRSGTRSIYAIFVVRCSFSRALAT
jgi:pimeloyl-ACP methyl ester carboxylesterase